MHVGDVLALCGKAGVTLCCDKYHGNLHLFASQQVGVIGLPVPKILPAVDAPRLRLLEQGSGVEVNAHIFITDEDADVKRKIKKAVCDPKQPDFCPPLEWVAVLIAHRGDFVVRRVPEYGGDATYTEVECMRHDFDEKNGA